MEITLARLVSLIATASLFFLTTSLVTAEAQTAATKEIKRPPIVGVAHIALNTDDLGALRAFYTGMLGFEEAFSLNKPDGSLLLTNFKVNDHQFIQVFPGRTSAGSQPKDPLSHICFETTDAEQLRAYLASKGVQVPEKLEPGQNGALAFEVHDADGHAVEFVQYLPGSMYAKDFGKHLGAQRASERIIHVGFTVKDRAAADHLYRDILGFKLQWYGGMKDDVTDWVAMRVPDGTDWLEYMLNVKDQSPRVLGIMNHLALGTPSVKDSYAEVLKRGMKNVEPPKIGRDGKWQLNLYDPELTRAELMEPAPVEKPCCSEIMLK